MKKLFSLAALGAVFLFVLVGGYRIAYAPGPVASVPISSMRTVEVGGNMVRVTVADTDEARQRGLSGRRGLAADEGMLFVFPQDGAYAFWMKDMLFSIDILWISGDGKVVYMAEDVSPDTYPQSFRSDVPARYVLELPAGYAKEYTVNIGDVVRF